MKLFLKAKHWQLFLLITVIPNIIYLAVIIYSIFNLSLDPLIDFMPVAIIILSVPACAQLYALGTSLHEKLPATVEMPVNKFKLFMLINVLFMLVVAFALPTFFIETYQYHITPRFFPVILFVPAYLFVIYSMYYCIYFCAKALKAVEEQKPVELIDYLGEFFLIMYLIVGIWFIQPRVNKIFAEEDTSPVPPPPPTPPMPPVPPAIPRQ